MTKWFILSIIAFIILGFFGLSLYAIFTFEFPYNIVGVPGSGIIGFIVGDWFVSKL